MNTMLVFLLTLLLEVKNTCKATYRSYFRTIPISKECKMRNKSLISVTMHTNTSFPGLMHLILYSTRVLLLRRMQRRFIANYHLFFSHLVLQNLFLLQWHRTLFVIIIRNYLFLKCKYRM